MTDRDDTRNGRRSEEDDLDHIEIVGTGDDTSYVQSSSEIASGSIYDKLKAIENVPFSEQGLDALQGVEDAAKPAQNKSFRTSLILLVFFVAAVVAGIYGSRYFDASKAVAPVTKDGAVVATEQKQSSGTSSLPPSVPTSGKTGRKDEVIPHVLKGSRQFVAALQGRVEKNPADHVAFNNLAVSLHDAGQNEDALRYAQRALFLRPDVAYYWSSLGVILTSMDLHQDAEKCFRKAIEISPSTGMFYFNLAALYERSGNDGLARQNYLAYLEKADTINPDNVVNVRKRLQKE